MTGTLNMEVIDELLALSEDGDPELLVDLIRMYLDDGPVKLALIRSGVESKDWDRVERAAHALKGAAGNLGAVQVQAVCDHIQSACRQHRTDDLGQQAQVLAEDLARAEGALRELLDRLRQ